MKLNFTKKALQILEAPSKGQKIYIDQGCKGLNLIITSAGSKTFYFRACLNGEQRRFRIGPFPDISLDEARDASDEKRTLVAKGIDPDAEIKARRAEHTLDEFFDDYLTLHAKKHKKTWQYDINTYNFHVKARLGKRKLSDISRQDIEMLHTTIADTRGKSIADHVLALLEHVFNKAIEWEHYTKPVPPTKYIKRFPRVVRKRRLDADELRRLLQTLMNEINTDLRDFVIIALFTGARKGNIFSMRWRDVIWEERRWHIPMTKNGEGLDIPLHNLVIALLKTRQSYISSEFVFPGKSTDGHIRKPRGGWKSLLKRAGIEDLNIHDLRRTYGTWLGKTGTGAFVISRSLGQRDAKSAQVYTHLNVEDVRSASQQAIEDMLGTLNP